jgi:hypothetical protein
VSAWTASSSGVDVAGVGVLTGWGEGVAALPDDAKRAAGDRLVIPMATPAFGGERFRRATRECVLGVAAVQALLRQTGLPATALAGDDTALVHVTLAAYGASNRIFAGAGSGGTGALAFPYTAPSVLPAEVAIEFGVRGAGAVLIGGARSTLDALWHGARLLAEGAAARVLVLAVETFAECEDLWARGRWTVARPLVESAACALLVPGVGERAERLEARASVREAEARRRAGETFSCGPLIALALDVFAGAREGRAAGRQTAGRR